MYDEYDDEADDQADDEDDDAGDMLVIMVTTTTIMLTMATTDDGDAADYDLDLYSNLIFLLVSVIFGILPNSRYSKPCVLLVFDAL